MSAVICCGTALFYFMRQPAHARHGGGAGVTYAWVLGPLHSVVLVMPLVLLPVRMHLGGCEAQPTRESACEQPGDKKQRSQCGGWLFRCPCKGKPAPLG